MSKIDEYKRKATNDDECGQASDKAERFFLCKTRPLWLPLWRAVFWLFERSNFEIQWEWKITHRINFACFYPIVKHSDNEQLWYHRLNRLLFQGSSNGQITKVCQVKPKRPHSQEQFPTTSNRLEFCEKRKISCPGTTNKWKQFFCLVLLNARTDSSSK